MLGTQDVSHLLSSQMHFGTISELPVSSDLWIGYTSYLDKNLKVLIETSLPIHVDSIMMIFYLFNTKRCFSLQVPSVLRSVYYRATRNCTWVGEPWTHYLLSLERIHASEELQHVSSMFSLLMYMRFCILYYHMILYVCKVDGKVLSTTIAR